MTWPVLALILNRRGFDGTLIGLSSAGQSIAVFLALPLTPRLLIWPVVFFAGFALSGVWTAAVVLIGQRFQGAELSSAYVGGGILYGVGSIAGPLLTGLATDATSLAAVPFVLAGFCAIYLAAAGPCCTAARRRLNERG